MLWAAMLSFDAVIFARAYAWNYLLHPSASPEAPRQLSLIHTGRRFMFMLASAGPLLSMPCVSRSLGKLSRAAAHHTLTGVWR